MSMIHLSCSENLEDRGVGLSPPFSHITNVESDMEEGESVPPTPRSCDCRAHLKRNSSLIWTAVFVRRLGECLLLESSTIAHAWCLFDLFLKQRKPNLSRLPLVGIGCLLLSTKYKESEYPSLQSLAAVVPYTASQISAMEILVLETLDWRLEVQTAHDLAWNLMDQICLEYSLAREQLMKELITVLDKTLQVECLFGRPPGSVATATVFYVLDKCRSNLPPSIFEWFETRSVATLRLDLDELDDCLALIQSV
uniref:Cyclin-like domain-containing protein n=1 Tax=Compsopogon caeruleus TaxID=31354 RepID=A0A7S1TDX1_9RHOD|mmetsp:Transcript_2466/g.4269  ORF Transcript_2466/g.4269 Transcript_2466/m.4269 type:complete len:253 (+) Transcript_2466:490-1248(+)